MQETSKKPLLPLRLLLVLLSALCSMTIFVPTAFAQTVDEDMIIVANGNILTMNPNQPKASAMALKEGKILEVGDLAAVRRAAGKSYEYVALEGKTVVPGFIESHEHLVQYGGTLALLNITPFTCPTLKEPCIS